MTASGTCSQLGQACGGSVTCCTGMMCNIEGVYPQQACPTGQTVGCVCQAHP
jgi:hypothetical protein